jgi:ParB/RepB/Spo0J family partition protein
MIEKQAAKYIADGGSVEEVKQITGLEFETVDPDMVAVDEMNERTDDTLDTSDLEDSIAEVGIVEPPVCRVVDEDAKVPYGVIQGQRRITAAQAVGLDEVPILVGDFDDLEALTRSITENISAASQDVSPNSRARAIWRWWVAWQQDRGEEVNRSQAPDADMVSLKFGIPMSTARDWIRHLEEDFAGTELDPRVNTISDDAGGREPDIKIQEVSPSILKNVQDMGFEKDDAVDVVKKVQKHGLTRQELRQVAAQTDNEQLDIDVDEAIQTQVEARQEAYKAKQKYILKSITMTGSNAKGLRAAESDLGKPREQVVKMAVQDFLDRRGYL